MQPIVVADDIPIPAFSSFGTASGVDNATEAEVRGLAFSKRAAASQPAGSGSRWCIAEISAERNVHVGSVFRQDFDVFTITAESSSGRQGRFIHANRVVADGRHLQRDNPETVRKGATCY